MSGEAEAWVWSGGGTKAADGGMMGTERRGWAAQHPGDWEKAGSTSGHVQQWVWRLLRLFGSAATSPHDPL